MMVRNGFVDDGNGDAVFWVVSCRIYLTENFCWVNIGETNDFFMRIGFL